MSGSLVLAKSARYLWRLFGRCEPASVQALFTIYLSRRCRLTLSRWRYFRRHARFLHNESVVSRCSISFEFPPSSDSANTLGLYLDCGSTCFALKVDGVVLYSRSLSNSVVTIFSKRLSRL